MVTIMVCKISHCYRSKGPKLKSGVWSLVLLLVCVTRAVECQTDSFPPQFFTHIPLAGAYLREDPSGAKVLLCQTSSRPPPTYRWMRDGEYFTDYQIYTTIRISNISRTVAGVYRCEANNSIGAILSLAANIEVAYMENFTQAGQTFTMVGETAKALVIPFPDIVSNPFPTVTWYENELSMSDEGYRHHVTLNKTLILLDRKLSESGSFYKAQALNAHADKQSTGPITAVTITGVSPTTAIAPEFVVPPADQSVNQGADKVDFECILNASPVEHISIAWYRYNDGSRTRITTSQKYILSFLAARTLTIKDPKLSDSGQYECEASMPEFPGVKTARANLTVHVMVKPEMTSSIPSEYSRDFGQSITIHCTASGIPSPSLHWYFNAQPVSLISDSRYSLHGNGSLTITQIDLEHAGVYQCFAENDAGERSQNTWLKVFSSPPRLVASPGNLTIVQGSNAHLPCEAQGAPKPTIVWTKVTETEERVIVSGGRYQVLDKELLITTAEPADSGLYKCNATNSQGSEHAQGTLTVYLQTQIIRPPQDLIITKGSPAELHCGVRHDAAITVTWQWLLRKPNEDHFNTVVPSSRHQIFSNGTLYISGTNSQDIGNYTCQVTSSGGNDSRTVSLTVIELPLPPFISSVVLHATDVRAAVVTWLPQYDGNTPILYFTVRYKVVNSVDDSETGWQTFVPNLPVDVRTADITGLKPARQYQFIVSATNRVGEGRPSEAKPEPGLLMPQQPPSSPPRFFDGVPASNTSIRLYWQPPPEDSWNGILEGYRIRYKLYGYPDTTFTEINVPTISVNPNYELTGLAFFQEYSIQIAAYNGEGVGVYTQMRNVSTHEGRPTAPPEDFHLDAVNSTAIRVEWRPPNPQFINGINRGYKIEARRVTDGTIENDTTVEHDQSNPTGVQFMYLVNKLKYTEYSVTVRCFTLAGDGPKTAPLTIRTLEDVPGEVGSLSFMDIRDKSLKVLWSVPAEINGVLTGYTLKYAKKNSTNSSSTIERPPEVLSHTIYDLTPSTKYTISVYASTRVGPGPARSADIESGVPPELPEPPHNLGVSNIEARSVLLQFLPGYDGKTSITLWIVEAKEGEETQFKEIFTISSPTARSITVQNLNPFTKYRLRIIAENVVGRSNYSVPTRSFQTLQDAPEKPPGNVTVRALNATALRVSWTPLSKREWNGDPRGYRIYYKRVDQGVFQMVVLDNGINMDSYIIGSLEEWMEYEVKMKAYNDVGSSGDSPITIERTRESVPSEGPVNVQASAISSTSINVTWGEVPILARNGLILGYKVQYRSDEEGIQPQFQDVAGGNTTFSVVIDNLRKFVQYEIRVLAFTQMGNGALSTSEVAVKTHEDVPGPPVIIWFPVVSYTEAEVVWEPPREPNGIISGYMVSYRLRDSGEPFINSSVLTASTRRYRVDNLQREAYYEFHVAARTRLSWGRSSAVEVYTMINRRPPDSPSTPIINQFQIRSRNITISWSPPAFNGYGPLRNFTVQYKSDIQQWTTVPEEIMPDINTYTVQRLRPNTRYWFRVAATNDLGMSDYSVMSEEAKTREAAPEGAPQNVSVVPLTTTSVKVTWEQPPVTTWNGDILGYTVWYRQGGQEVELPSVLANEREKILQNLKEKVNYEFWVIAFNSIGTGPASPPVTVYVGEAAPTAAPTSIDTHSPSSTEIMVTWNPPPPDTQNGELSGYKVYYWLSGQPESSGKQIIVREQGVLLTELQIYTDYSIAIQAYNLAGDGPKSTVHHQKTGQGVPGRPGTITFWNITYTSLNVSWLPPAAPNGMILSYGLSYEEESVHGNVKEVKFRVPGHENHLYVDNLAANGTYIFSIRARTVVGEGNHSESRIKTGPQLGSPGAPSSPLFVIDANKNILTLMWTQGYPGSAPVNRHTIEYRVKDGDWVLFMRTGNATSVDISFSALNREMEYRFRVTAFNAIGIGIPSAPSALFHIPAPAEKPFHHEWWFLVIVALTGFIIILVIISLLCLMSRRRSKPKKAPGSATSTSNLAPATAEPEDGGFGNMEMSRRSSRRTTRPFAGIRTGSASAKSSSIYARSPPRPSPASVAYSDDDSNSASKPPIPDDDSQSTMTEKPSELGDSTEPSDQESDEDSIDPPLPPPPPIIPASPPPPPFSTAIRNHYINEPVQNSWQQQPNSSFNAYQYTDSEAESSHYAMSLNGGQIIMNNTAGSRAPLPGFSSFV